jgi:hypothetical protein
LAVEPLSPSNFSDDVWAPRIFGSAAGESQCLPELLAAGRLRASHTFLRGLSISAENADKPYLDEKSMEARPRLAGGRLAECITS